MNRISETATIEDGVVMGDGNVIHDYVLIKKGTVLGDGNEIGRFSQVGPFVTMGDRNKLDFQVVLGGAPQDLAYKGEKSGLTIGDDNTFREFCTAHRGDGKGSDTRIGDRNFFMGYTHVAHNCRVGNHCVLTNYVGLSGYVVMEDYAILGGHAGCRQFCRVGAHSMVGGMTKVNLDVPPYALADGAIAGVRGVNVVGLKRRGFSREEVQRIKECFEMLFQPGRILKQALDRMADTFPNDPHARRIIDFCSASKRGITPFNK